MRAVALIAVLAGCYNPGYDDCALSCAQSGICPSGLKCEGGMCRTQSGPCGGGDGDAGIDADVNGWRQRKTVTITSPSTVDNFPVLIRTTDQDLAVYAQPSGADIRFTTIDGIALPHEIERFYDPTGELVAWVKIPHLVSTIPFQAWMYYDNPNATRQQTPPEVWDADYLGVWHLSDPAGSTIVDSTSSARNGSKGASNSPALIADGIAAGAQDFNSAAASLFAIPPMGMDIETLTFEAWLRITQSTQPGVHWIYAVPPSFTSELDITYDDTNSGGFLRLGTNSGQMSAQSAAGTLGLGAWHHVVVTFGTGAPLDTLFVDGVQVPLTNPPNSVVAATQILSIGGAAGSPEPGMLGSMDELRISKVVRPPGYAGAVYGFSKPDSVRVRFGVSEIAP